MALGDPLTRQNSHCTTTMHLNAILKNTLLFKFS